MDIKNFFSNYFEYTATKKYNFFLPDSQIVDSSSSIVNLSYSNDLSENVNFLKNKYNIMINSDIKLRHFTLSFNSTNYSACIIYIDGMIDDKLISSSILQPIMMKSSIIMKPNAKKINNTANFLNLDDFLINSLIQHSNITKETDFEKIISKINSGFCALLVDKMPSCLCIEVKNIKGRNISQPITEYVIRGSQEAFVENLRTNTSLLRKIINNENLIIEETRVGKISKTEIAICYMKNIANDNLVSEVKYRINNLKVDFILSSGQLEQLIKDSSISSFPQVIATERPDRVSSYLLGGRIAIIVNGSPFAIVVPAVFVDFMSTIEDKNISFLFANFLKTVRCLAVIFAVFLPGMYVAITNFHQELIPSELLFAIADAREAIPFPVIFEILLMEFSFELIREAGLRVASSFSTTIGIIGALILGDAAVAANIVSPILIIVIAFTGICDFAIPDYSLSSSIRIFRFMYTILGFIAGFLGIAFGFFIHFIYLSSLSSFGVPYFTPYIPFTSLKESNGLLVKPLWKIEKRNSFLNTKSPKTNENISMKWRK